MHVDTASSAKASRPKLGLVLQLLCEGDMLKVTRLNRLSRSGLHLVALGAELRERGIGLHVVEQGIATSTRKAGRYPGCCPRSPSSSASRSWRRSAPSDRTRGTASRPRHR
ncbi:recombinase family protein [Streptomyces atratus]|nr:recombinase family protein [Streptomyces atratus]